MPKNVEAYLRNLQTCDTVRADAWDALGDYAGPCSTRLISSKDEHSTERADLRGQRLLVAEELTENRALNVTAIKQVTDIAQIKARYVHRDNQTFVASHSIFITTNYVPVVNETDHGTWRRLALLVFPYVYRKAEEGLFGFDDRHGDSGLKARLQAGREGQHDAIVTWAIEGAREWYRSGFPPLPSSVANDTRDWRKSADRILGFWDERAGGLVVNRTGLTGAYELQLDIESPDLRATGDASGVDTRNVFTAVREQLGLKLEPEKILVPVLVVDAIQRPSEN